MRSSGALGRPLTALGLIALVATCWQLVSRGSEAAQETSNESVGYRACLHLMIRLVDCLIEACERYLWPAGSPLAQPAADGAPRQVAAIGPLNQVNPAPLRADGRPPSRLDSSQLKQQQQKPAADSLWLMDGMEEDGPDGEQPTTKPMNWVQPERLGYLNPTNSSSAEVAMQTSGISRKVVEWIRSQLIVMRGQLQIGSEERLTLANCLHRFAEMSEHAAELLSAKDQQARDRDTFDELDFVLDAIGVLVEIEESTHSMSVMAIRPSSREEGAKAKEKEKEKETTKSDDTDDDDEQSNYYDGHKRVMSERDATEAIKSHYLYLSQIITSFSVLFKDAGAGSLNGPNKPLPIGPQHIV